MTATPTNLLDKSLTIERRTTAVDSTGIATWTWASHLTSVAARVQPMSGSEVVRYGRESSREMWRFYVAASHDITSLDRVIYVDSASVSHTLDIQEVVDLQENGALKRLICQETA